MTDLDTIPETWAERNPVDAPAVQVTFFEDRAEVIRRTTVQLPEGCTFVTLLGASVFLDDPSVVVKALGGDVRTLGTRVLRSMRTIPEAGPGEIERLEQAVREATDKRIQAQQAVDRADLARTRTATLLEAWAQAMAQIPRGGMEATATWMASFEMLEKEMWESLDRASRHRWDNRLANLQQVQAQLRLDLGKRLEPDYRAAVEVQLESKQAGQVELELIYRTPCALWRPEHVARLITGADGKHELVLQTLATVWQATGEVWDGIRCRFSTARPARTASPPLLHGDILRSRRKTDTERKQVVVEERDEAIANVGLERGARQVEEMPGVEDGGEAIGYEATKPCTIVSDGHPFRVELQERRLDCEVDRISYPERSEAVHFRATATLAGSTPLLAGPMWIAREGAIVGRSKTGFVGQGEPFELGMGVDDGLRVRRTFEEKRDTTPVIGTQKIKRRVNLFVSNLGGTERLVHVVERYPMSEIEDVKVEVTSHREGRVDGRDGFVHYEVVIPARGTKELLMEYRIEAGSRVVI